MPCSVNSKFGVKKEFWSLPGSFWFIAIFLLFCLQVAHGYSIAAEAPEETARPKIGLVLSGGGARGAAHIGVIKILEEMRIPIDYIGGTSMGAIVGGLYASGMSSEELEKTVTGIDWAAAFKDDIPREDRSFRRKTDDRTYLVKAKPGLSDDLDLKFPPGLLQGQQIDIILKKLALPVSSIHDFDNFKIPFRAIATDIVTGKAVILASGDLAMSMRASMSIPAAFAPTVIDGRMLVDGGVSNNLPVDVVRNLGADIIIAIDISTPLAGADDLQNALQITKQLTGILTRSNTEEQIATLAEKDIFIVPDLGDITSSDFDRAGAAIAIGLQAAAEKKQELAHLGVSQPDYGVYLAARSINQAKRETEPPLIDFIKLDNQSRVSDKMILARLKIQTGQPLDVANLEKDISEIYGLELFENITYEIVEENSRTGLVLHVKERSWGPNYIQAGMELSGNEDGDSYYNFVLAYTRTAINRLNGEWRTILQVGKSPGIFSEIYQPLDANSRYFIHPKLLYIRKTVNIYLTGGDRLADYRVTEYGIDIAAGREFGTWGESRIGIRRSRGDSEVAVGNPGFSDYDFDRGEVYLRLSADKLDDLNFPRDGFAGSVEYSSSQEDFGADSSFDQVIFDALYARSWGRNTLIGGVGFHTTLESDAPLQNLFQMGGLFNLSGYLQDELSGQHSGLMELIYMRRINDFNLMPAYLGASLESGNVWQDEDDIGFDSLITAGSLFFGIDTFLGPVYIGYGLAEGGRNNFYFSLGQTF
jgi:NTE family protein